MNVNPAYNEKIIQWSAEEGGGEYLIIDKKIQFLSDYLYNDFEPTFGPFPDFHSRLAKWITNLPNEPDQKLLFKLMPKIFYLSREEFNSLHRTAFNSAVKTWLLEQSAINFEIDDYNSHLKEAIDQTWFCPVTDSFRINQFYHLNQIPAKQTFRPDWRSLKQFGDATRIIDYIRGENIKYLVLLEDFVGSGSQCTPSLKFVCDLFSSNEAKDLDLKILFIPMIVCPAGIKKIKDELVGIYSNFCFKTIIEIKNSEIINQEQEQSNSNLSPYVEMIKRTFQLVKGDNPSLELKRIQEFGYRNTGGLVVMYTNTPNNSLPIVFVESNSWSPLFKRHFRD